MAGGRNTSRGRGWGKEVGLWPCGHPRTPENTQRVGVAGSRCRACRQRICREHDQRVRNRRIDLVVEGF